MVNRILRDDPAKGLTAIQEPATMRDIIDTWKDSSTWGLYLIGYMQIRSPFSNLKDANVTQIDRLHSSSSSLGLSFSYIEASRLLNFRLELAHNPLGGLANHLDARLGLQQQPFP